MSDTPIYVRLTLEYEWWDRPLRFVAGFDPRLDADRYQHGHLGIWAVPEPETVSVDILPDTTNFLEGMRVGGRRPGRSAEWDELVHRVLCGASPTPIYDELKQEQFNASMRESVARAKAVFVNYALAMNNFALAVMPAVIDAERQRQEVAAWVQKVLSPAPTRGYGISFAVIDEMDPRARALSQTNRHYPTSAPSWARRSRR